MPWQDLSRAEWLLGRAAGAEFFGAGEDAGPARDVLGRGAGFGVPRTVFDGAPVPTELVAVSDTEYCMPLTRPVSVNDVVAGTATYHVKGAVKETFEDTQTTTVTKDIVITSSSTKIHITAATEE